MRKNNKSYFESFNSDDAENIIVQAFTNSDSWVPNSLGGMHFFAPYGTIDLPHENKKFFATVNVLKKSLNYKDFNVSVLWYKFYTKEIEDCKKTMITRDTCEVDIIILVAPFDSFNRPELDGNRFYCKETVIGVSNWAIVAHAKKLARLDEFINLNQSISNYDQYMDELWTCERVFDSLERLHKTSYTDTFDAYKYLEWSPFLIKTRNTDKSKSFHVLDVISYVLKKP